MGAQTTIVKQEQRTSANILFCIADDAGHISAYGTQWVHTPAFDRVARKGILFKNTYTCNATMLVIQAKVGGQGAK